MRTYADEQPTADRNETELERADRNLAELLQEVRVVQTGVQVLFGFLLAIVFQTRFKDITTFQKADYLVTLLAAVAAAILLMAPTAYHRLLFRQGDKQHLVDVANRLTMIGLAAVGVSMIGVVLLICDTVFNSAIAVAASTLAAAGCLLTWFVLPFLRRRGLRRAVSRPEKSLTRPSPIRRDDAGESAPPRSDSRGLTRL
jgi:predicted membrane channel-forming protein YqfA (hemolysin III family)